MGEVCKVNDDGTFFVDYSQNVLGPLEARTVVEDLHLGSKVLLAFEGGDPTLPIVLGLVTDRIRRKGRVLHLKASTVVVEADDHLLLQCGCGKIEATRDGRLRLRGKEIVSRASRTNKVQGSTVKMN